MIGVAESSIRAVPDSYYEGALALGATRERSVFFAVLPGAKSGILAGVVLGIGRASARRGGDHGSRKSAGDTGETWLWVFEPLLPTSLWRWDMQRIFTEKH